MNGLKATDPRVQPGWWAFHCCHEDLMELDSETLADVRADQLCFVDTYECFPTKNEALEEIVATWERSGYPDEAAIARAMMDGADHRHEHDSLARHLLLGPETPQ